MSSEPDDRAGGPGRDRSATGSGTGRDRPFSGSREPGGAEDRPDVEGPPQVDGPAGKGPEDRGAAAPGGVGEGRPRRGEAAPDEGHEALPGEAEPTPEGGHDAFPGPGQARLLDPRVRIVWWVRGLVWTGVIAGGAAFLDYQVIAEAEEAWVPGRLTAAVAAIWLVLALVLPPLRYRRWRYALRAHDLWIRRGILWVTVSVVPYRRLQFVDTDQGPLARLFGLAELVVHTAAPGTSGRIPGLDADEAESLRERLAAAAPDDPGFV